VRNGCKQSEIFGVDEMRQHFFKDPIREYIRDYLFPTWWIQRREIFSSKTATKPAEFGGYRT
jgi:hypothetical protein